MENAPDRDRDEGRDGRVYGLEYLASLRRVGVYVLGGWFGLQQAQREHVVHVVHVVKL